MENDLMHWHLFLLICGFELDCVLFHVCVCIYIYPQYERLSLQPRWLPDSPVFEKCPAQSCVTAADWVSWSRDLCFHFDRRVWDFWVKSSLRLYLWRLLSWWLMTGSAFQWVKEFCWMSFLHCIKHMNKKPQCCLHKLLLVFFSFC